LTCGGGEGDAAEKGNDLGFEGKMKGQRRGKKKEVNQSLGEGGSGRVGSTGKAKLRSYTEYIEYREKSNGKSVIHLRYKVCLLGIPL